MTPNEYMKKISKQITNSSSEEEAIALIEKAQRVIDNSKISTTSKEKFWIDLYEELGGEHSWACESQDSSALSAIIAAAKAAIAKKANK
ncbi:hypothetical protein [Shewanella algae]|uniref:hypothetical protein n=1 Tax=Shewanella algae TaxID=38313 RepID=UPI0039998447